MAEGVTGNPSVCLSINYEGPQVDSIQVVKALRSTLRSEETKISSCLELKGWNFAGSPRESSLCTWEM